MSLGTRRVWADSPGKNLEKGQPRHSQGPGLDSVLTFVSLSPRGADGHHRHDPPSRSPWSPGEAGPVLWNRNHPGFFAWRDTELQVWVSDQLPAGFDLVFMCCDE